MEDKLPEPYFSPQLIHTLCRIVFAVILFDLVMAGFSNTLIHQLRSPVLKYSYLDPSYWIMNMLYIPELISSNSFLAWTCDIILFGSCIGALIFPQKKWIIALFIVFYFLYFIIFNSFGSHHTHFLVPVLIAPVPFLFSQKRFSYTWEALRYFTLFIYSAAFLWKFFRFSWLSNDQGILIVKKNLAPYLYFNPNTLLAGIYVWFLNNPLIIEIIFFTGFIFEGVFIIGFFTKKYDQYLFFISLILPFGFWFLADTVFYENLILSITLLHFGTKSKFLKNGKTVLMSASNI